MPSREANDKGEIEATSSGHAISLLIMALGFYLGLLQP